MRCKSVVLALGLFAVTQAVFADAKSDIRIIIKYKTPSITSASLKSQIASSTHLPVRVLSPMANGAYSLILTAPTASLATQDELLTPILAKLRQDPNVQYAVKDRVGHFKPLPEPKINPELSNLLSHDTQWDEFTRPSGIMLESKPGLRDGAWAYTTGKTKKKPVVVAVLDTGTALNDSLINNLVKDKEGNVWGWNFADNNNNIADETGSYHGTHVAGTIAGYGSVMTGMGEDLKILTVKIPNANGMFYESAVINGIYWSVGSSVPRVPENIHPAKVLNMSFGVDLEPGREIDYCDEALQEAVFFARKKGAVLAVAAGNDNVWEHLNAPAVCNGTIKVASTGPEGLRSYFSNYGPSVSFAAPGGDKRYGVAGGILSTVNPGGGYNGSGFDFYQGTSMATPHVAGVAGLVFDASSKTLTAEKVEQILYTTTHDFGTSTDSNKSCVGKKPCGHGILDAEHAVKATLDDYEFLFTAPKLTALTNKDCAKGTMKAITQQVHIDKVLWTKITDACASEESYQHPRVVQAKNGAIYAYYGELRYKLDQSSFSDCKVVGYDGIGCHA
ncbi:S8 family serine peptidase [Legionella sp. km772]|uniref:S8 family serine peptidase n=1 Tax=Legionella sp. km772 TaxID=2498111 RepID=UPI000F8F6965|nr:S8 family serine peptidase [Legionella sp. km772]RUR09884.1 serine metalloprotease [Legionella sp. km772]